MQIHQNYLNIVFWNANGIKNRKIELQDFINNHSPDLLLIQESHLQKQDKFYLPNFHCFKDNRDNPLYIRAAGGTATFIKRHLPYHQISIPPLQHIEATVISLNLPNLDPIIIASIYVPVTSDPQLFTLDLESIMQLESNIIMCGDFNAHHQVWNCSTNRPRGNQLLKFANQTNLYIIAPITPTRFGYNSTSTIDLALIKNFLFPYDVTSLSEHSSDHNPIEISFKFNYILPPDNSNININWTFFTNLFIEKHAHPLPIINSANSLDLEIRNFTDDLLAAHRNASKPYNNRNDWIHPNDKKKTYQDPQQCNKRTGKFQGTPTTKPFLIGLIKTSKKPSKTIRINYERKTRRPTNRWIILEFH
ncbi:putative RNA-directed DNA polymerase from transposon X-element [Caerostris extrusa]|uniref:RNA-directed DNA polymerase from transposon X-element n=1 Tax=Caerostris extrusa TaxID=172846 RepID=A0AAV4P0N3_CAEEX|nr:putative RNA-directed DNA polymerase from transposon X-element [Caerostris extrusa]